MDYFKNYDEFHIDFMVCAHLLFFFVLPTLHGRVNPCHIYVCPDRWFVSLCMVSRQANQLRWAKETLFVQAETEMLESEILRVVSCQENQFCLAKKIPLVKAEAEILESETKTSICES